MNDVDIERILKVRGYSGGNEPNSIKLFQKSAGLTQDGIVGPKTAAALAALPRVGMLKEDKIRQLFGEPGDGKNRKSVKMPFVFRVAWDLSQKVQFIDVHKLLADRFVAVWKEVLDVYGLSEVQRLGLDLYGGCYNFRKMRGGTSWSRHSWAMAWDVDPDRNTLHETAATARLARPEYVAFILIWYKHGFCSQGVEKGFDWMHFEAVK